MALALNLTISSQLLLPPHKSTKLSTEREDENLPDHCPKKTERAGAVTSVSFLPDRPRPPQPMQTNPPPLEYRKRHAYLPPPTPSSARWSFASIPFSSSLLHLNSAPGSARARISLKESRSVASHFFVIDVGVVVFAFATAPPSPEIGGGGRLSEEAQKEREAAACSWTSCIHMTSSAAAAAVPLPAPVCAKTGNSRACDTPQNRTTGIEKKGDRTAGNDRRQYRVVASSCAIAHHHIHTHTRTSFVFERNDITSSMSRSTIAGRPTWKQFQGSCAIVFKPRYQLPTSTTTPPLLDAFLALNLPPSCLPGH